MHAIITRNSKKKMHAQTANQIIMVSRLPGIGKKRNQAYLSITLKFIRVHIKPTRGRLKLRSTMPYSQDVYSYWTFFFATVGTLTNNIAISTLHF